MSERFPIGAKVRGKESGRIGFVVCHSPFSVNWTEKSKTYDVLGLQEYVSPNLIELVEETPLDKYLAAVKAYNDATVKVGEADAAERLAKLAYEEARQVAQQARFTSGERWEEVKAAMRDHVRSEENK